MKIICSLREVESRRKQIQEENLQLKEYFLQEENEHGEIQFVLLEGVKIMIPKHSVYMRVGKLDLFDESDSESKECLTKSNTKVYFYHLEEKDISKYCFSCACHVGKALRVYLDSLGLQDPDIMATGCIMELEA